MELSKKVVSVGICAMGKKVNTKHMQKILNNLKKFDELKIVVFPEKLILDDDIENWPIVESMIVFFSTGFPYNKALEYINLRKPFLVNDFEIQKVFWDRRQIKKMLRDNDIPIPKGIIVDRGEIINNDRDSGCKIELNTSAEIEKMIDEYNNANNGKSEIENTSNLTQIKEIDDKELIKIANQDEFFIDEDDDCNIQRNLSLNSRQSSTPPSSPLISIIHHSEEIDNNSENEFLKEETDLEEFDEYIEYKGRVIKKPFVEKPANGDDHNVYIYYPQDGGQKRLFRKTKNLSSLYYPHENKIRRDKSYIYEEFLQSDGFDVKVYTVGEDYAHAEARKSPTLDGLVQRASNGKEVRYPINLTKEEKEIARKIVKVFKQNVCGFDILRAQGKSYVCDVNGWSFVKGNKKYYEDCAIQIRKIILTELEPKLLYSKNTTSIPKEIKFPNDTIKPQEELRSIIGIFRNADRAPKQEIQISVKDPMLLDIYYKYNKGKVNIINGVKCPGEVKIKKGAELLDVLCIVNKLLMQKGINEDELGKNIENTYVRLFQVKLIIEKNKNFEGITRKIQIKPIKWDVIKEEGKKDKFKITEALMIMKWGGHITHSGIEQAKRLGKKIRSELYPGEDLLRLHSTYRHDLKCYSSDEGRCLKSAAAFLQGLLELDGSLIPILTSMVNTNKLLDLNLQEDPTKKVLSKLKEICNFNGPLIDQYKSIVGDCSNKEDKEQQSTIELINSINNFYSQMDEVYNDLHLIKEHLKTFINKKELSREIKTYFVINRSSLAPKKNIESFSKIRQRFVEIDKKIKKKNKKKQRIKSLSYGKKNLNENFDGQKKLSHQKLNIAKSLMRKESKATLVSSNDCEEENVIMKLKRYIKLYEKFYNKETKQYDISKIIDIYDNIKYDLIHNKSIMNDVAYQLYHKVSKLASFVIPLEYGITSEEKSKIAKILLRPLLQKLQSDLLRIDDSDLVENVNSIRKTSNPLDFLEKTYSGLDKKNINDNENIASFRHVKTRFYFTSYPHLYLLLNSIKSVINSDLKIDKDIDEQIWKIFDLDYCSHIIFRVFENFEVSELDKNRYRVEILVSSGADNDPRSSDSKHMIPSNSKIVLNNHLTIDDLQKYFNFLLKG